MGYYFMHKWILLIGEQDKCTQFQDLIVHLLVHQLFHGYIQLLLFVMQ